MRGEIIGMFIAGRTRGHRTPVAAVSHRIKNTDARAYIRARYVARSWGSWGISTMKCCGGIRKYTQRYAAFVRVHAFALVGRGWWWCCRSFCQFCKIDAEKSPFLVERLQIVTLPTILCIKDGKTVHQVVGFDEFGVRALSLSLRRVPRELACARPVLDGVFLVFLFGCVAAGAIRSVLLSWHRARTRFRGRPWSSCWRRTRC